MTQAAANLLIDRFAHEPRWPLEREKGPLSTIAKMAAFRDVDEGEEVLRSLHPGGWPSDRSYVIDPLGDLIAETYADLQWGEDPRIKAAMESDTDRLGEIIETNDLGSELHRAEIIRVSEGEVWGRMYSDVVAAPHPMLEFHSRERIVPEWVGRRLVAAGFVTEYEEDEDKAAKGDRGRTVWRLIEIHSFGRVENVLYRGNPDWLGAKVDLGAFDETSELTEVWDHDLPGMSMWRVANKVGRNPRLGISDFARIKNLLLALNEITTIGVENARLTIKKRAIMPESAVQPSTGPEYIDRGDGQFEPKVQTRGSVDGGADVFTVPTLDGELGSPDQAPFKVLEYSSDVEELISYKKDLIVTAASRVKLMAAFLGVEAGSEGMAQTGTALRVRLFPTKGGAQGKRRGWRKVLPEMLVAAQVIDSMPAENFGFAVGSWSGAGKPPSVEPTDPLPEDETEAVQRHVTAVGGPVESVETAVRQLHGDWSEEQVKDEIDRIREDRKTSAPQLPIFGAAPPGDDEDDDPAKPPPSDEPPGDQ